MTQEDRRALEAEYLALVARWDDFDRRALSIKAWVAAGMVVASTQLPKEGLTACFLAAVVTISAWLMEAIWKAFQHADSKRICALEEYFRGGAGDIHPMQIHTTWGAAWGRDKRTEKIQWDLVFKEAKRPFVLIPYLPFLLVIGLCAIPPLIDFICELQRAWPAQP